MLQRKRHRDEALTSLDESQRRTPQERSDDRDLLWLQRTAGNQAVQALVSNPTRAPALARALLQRQGTEAAHDATAPAKVDIGQPAPAQVTPTDLAAPAPTPPAIAFARGGQPAPATAPVQAPAATTPAPGTTANAQTEEGAHPDPTLGLDPFNVQVTITIADLHAWRARSRIADIDFLADPSAGVQVGTGPQHAVAAQASVNVILAHIKQNGDSVVDLGLGPTAQADQSGVAVGAQAQAEAHVTERVSITFTAGVTPQRNVSGGVDLSSSAVVGTVLHF